MNKIPSPLVTAAEKYRDYPALIDDKRIITYSQYLQLVSSVMKKLSNCGITAGQKVAVLADNSIELIVLLTACFHAGVVACPISKRFPEKTILSMLDDIGCSIFIDGLNKNINSEKIRKIPLASLINRNNKQTSKDVSSRDFDLDREATIVFTSGTSALPKAVLLSLGNHYYNAAGSNQNIFLQPDDRWLMSLPLFHVSGLGILFRTLLTGAGLVIPASGESLITSIKKYKITHLSIVSIQLQRLLNEPDIKETVGYLKAVLLGGSAFSEKLINQAYDLNLKLYTTYGLTEMASQVTTTTAGDSKEKKLTSGKLLKHREIKINNSGEILVRGKTLFKGYFHQRKLITPFDDEGWLATSDLGNIDSDGYLTVTGRKDNMFISGGENIHPEEIEQVLTCSDNIEAAIVVPVSDNEYGFRPVAFIRYKDKKTKFDSNDLNLPHYKIPIRFFDLAADLLNNSLKPNRKRLQELAEKLIKN